MARYEAGETLASIARTYDCSPPAISYVVSRSRERHPGAPKAPAPPGLAEAPPQLIKAAATEAAPRTSGLVAPAPATAVVQQSEGPPPVGRPNGGSPLAGAPLSGGRRESAPGEAEGAPHSGDGDRHAGFPGLPPRAAPRPPAAPTAVGPTNGDQRRTLHLSLGQPHSNGGAHAGEMQRTGERLAPSGPTAEPAPHPLAERALSPADPARPQIRPTPEQSDSASPANGFSEPRPAAYPTQTRSADPDGRQRKDSGAFIDRELRARVEGDIAAFLAAFDAALLQDTQENRSALREATDRLLRAGARTRIELERLEARMPLPPRDRGGREEPAWRHR